VAQFIPVGASLAKDTAMPPSRTVLAALILLIVSALPSLAQALKPWRHGIVDPKGDAGFQFMVGHGDFAAKQGLKVETLAMRDGAIAHKALLAGEVDSIWSSPGQAIIAGARGADLKIVGCDWPKLTHGLMVRAPIASVADLKGKTVAVASPGSLPNLVLGAILAKYNVPRAEVHQAPLGGDPDRFKALMARVADAGIIVSEFLSVAPPDITMLVPGREALPNYVRSCVTMSGKTLATRHDDAVAFITAYMQGVRFALTHRTETIQLTREIIGAIPDDPRAPYVYDDTIKNGLIDPDMGLPMEGFRWMQDEFVKGGNLNAAGDIAKVADPTIRDAALLRLGK
jgi:NitT/TauT family transport system substrate-binding protein